MSLSKKRIGALACSLALSISAALAWGAEDGLEVVAEIGGKKITRAQFEQQQSAELLTARYKFYEAEKKALDELIDNELLKQQAEREHVSVDELLQRHVTSTVKEPSDDQLRLFYEMSQSQQPYEAVRDQIVEGLRKIRTAKARADYLKTLREQDSTMVELAPPRMDVHVGDAPIRGSKNAPVTLIEFADYQCPYCQKVAPDLKRLESEFSGKVAFACKDFPLPIHNNAPKAAEAARCAGKQGKFWEYHDMLFQKKELDKGQLEQYAGDLKLDQARFNTCLDSGEEAAAVQKDVDEGLALGISQTPCFFVNGHFFTGAIPYPTLRDLVQQQVTAAEKSTGRSTRAAR